MGLPQVQTVATVPELGGELKFVHDYPVPKPGQNEVLAKVLYSGVCQSGASSTTFPLSCNACKLTPSNTQTYTPKPVQLPVQMESQF